MPDHDAYESIAVSVDDGVARITLRRPEKLNALATAVMLDLQRAFSAIRLDRDVAVVVLEGAGEEAFSAGADIEGYAGSADEHDPHQRERQELFYEVYRAPYDCHAPTVAKIDGYCLGGGLILAMYCDLRVATADASFGVPVTDIGQIPTGGSTYRAIDLVGEAATKELVFTAGRVGADRAGELGLVNRVVPDAAALDDEVEGVVDAVRATGHEAVKRSKRALNAASEASDLDTARAREAELWWEQFATAERERLVGEFVDS
jgi:enoyl-CoA hydratase/carnithine racemase